MKNRMRHRKGTNGSGKGTHHMSRPRTLASCNRTVGIESTPDFALVREVQLRATGANIHALAQQLQIYVNAVECGAVLHAKAAEAKLRGWLASGG